MHPDPAGRIVHAELVAVARPGAIPPRLDEPDLDPDAAAQPRCRRA